MYYKNLKTFRRLEARKCKTYKLRNLLKLLRIFNCGNSLFYVCFLIMSFVIVKGSAVTIYQNRTSTEENSTASDIISNSKILSKFKATSSELITTKPEIQRYTALNYLTPQKDNLTVTNHIIGTNIIVGGIEATKRGGESKENLEKPAAENMRAKLQQLLQREIDEDEEKKQLQQEQQQQEQLQQQQQQQQHQHAILSSENAYLLERVDGSMHEQPIYGTWSAKARRPPAPLLAAATAAALTQSSARQPLVGEVDENYYDHHHYERLPRRSSTMTPVRRELHDQIPRPPRLTSRQPSFAIRRQFTDTPMPNGSARDESRPKPFHFPFEGPMPEEFKKFQQQQSERGGIQTGGVAGVTANDDVHNIQDILHKLNLGGPASKVPPQMMMPTGLHISGSFKNLKSSGLANFFRGKRNKKQMQLQFPMPMQMQMLNTYPQPLMNLMPQPYQQRIAMDQFYPFKARSPNDINLLAMQQQHQQYQQQQQQQFKQPHSKGKKQKKKQKDKKNALASSNLMLQQYPFATTATDILYPSLYPPFMAVNVTQLPPLPPHQLTKRQPFKVNLDIFPVMPPSKNYKNPALLAVDEARIASSMRPPSALRNPFVDYFSTPITPTASALNYYNPYNVKQPLYNAMRFPTGSQNPLISMAQSNSMQLAYPEQMQKYIQQQQQQQQQQQHLYANFLNTQGHQTPFLPIDCDQPLPPSGASSISATNSKSNPIMVHLNVFPKQKPSSPISTNPFYSNMPHIQRNTIQEESESSLSPVEPRHQGRSLNYTAVHNKVARSDTNEDTQQQQQQQQDLVDFEHPIVAAHDDDDDDDFGDNNAELPQPLALQGSKPNISTESSQSFYYDNRPNTTMLSTSNNNTNYNINYGNGNLEQMASEAKTASLFRFPVEDLIQFQVHDAM